MTSRIPLRAFAGLTSQPAFGTSRILSNHVTRSMRLYTSEPPKPTPTTPPSAATSTSPEVARRLAAVAAAKAAPPKKEEKPIPGSIDDIFRDTTVKDEKNQPPPHLLFPLGLRSPPRPGENTGEDKRTWEQRRADFKDYDKHLAKRAKLEKRLFTPYFRDFTRMSKDFRGKSFFAPNRLFKAEKALFFPNLVGRTLDGRVGVDTTPLLRGRISVVAVYSSRWGEKQAMSFMDGLEERKEFEGAQRVDVNIEENPAKLWILRMFLGSLRKQLPEERHGRYFIVSKGITDEIREATGLWNSKVGYVFLVDAACRIRWAASGDALPDEKEILPWGLKKLVDELEKVKSSERQ